MPFFPSQLLPNLSPPLTSMARGYELPLSPHAIIDCEDQRLDVEI